MSDSPKRRLPPYVPGTRGHQRTEPALLPGGRSRRAGFYRPGREGARRFRADLPRAFRRRSVALPRKLCVARGTVRASANSGPTRCKPPLSRGGLATVIRRARGHRLAILDAGASRQGVQLLPVVSRATTRMEPRGPMAVRADAVRLPVSHETPSPIVPCLAVDKAGRSVTSRPQGR